MTCFMRRLTTIRSHNAVGKSLVHCHIPPLKMLDLHPERNSRLLCPKILQSLGEGKAHRWTSEGHSYKLAEVRGSVLDVESRCVASDSSQSGFFSFGLRNSV